MKPKLYRAKIVVDSVFVARNQKEAEALADRMILDEIHEGGGINPDNLPDVEEITSLDQLPEGWKDALVWNSEEFPELPKEARAKDIIP